MAAGEGGRAEDLGKGRQRERLSLGYALGRRLCLCLRDQEIDLRIDMKGVFVKAAWVMMGALAVTVL